MSFATTTVATSWRFLPDPAPAAPATPATQSAFPETIDTLPLAEPWDIRDVEEVLAGLTRDGVDLLQGELIASAVTGAARPLALPRN